MPFRVPTVDISAYVLDGAIADRDRVAAEIDRACRDVGFIQITGHGVSDEVIAGLAEAMDAFFDLPIDEKTSYIRPAWENRGYSAPRTESLSLSAGVESATRMNDFFEAFNIGSTTGNHPDVSMPEHYARNTWPP